VQIPLPDESIRYEYLKNKIGNRITEENLKKLARLTDKFGFGHLKEMHKRVFVYKKPFHETLHNLKLDMRLERENNKDQTLIEEMSEDKL
jgi:hypothetical protein